MTTRTKFRWDVTGLAFAAGALAAAAGLVFHFAGPWTPDGRLFEACRRGDAGMVRLAIKHGANVSARDSTGLTPLMIACRGDRPDSKHPERTDRPEIVEELIARGADVNARTDSGFVAIFWAARYGHAGAARASIQHGADVNARDRDGMTALKWARTNGHTAVAALLRDAGAKE